MARMDKAPVTAEAAKWVRATIATRGITVEKLAAGSHIARPTLIRRLEGVQPFRLDEIELIARFLNVKVSEITAAAEEAAA